MARQYTKASNELLRLPGAVTSATQGTISCWAKLDTLASNSFGTLIAFGGGNAEYFSFRFWTSGTDLRLQTFSNPTGSSNIVYADLPDTLDGDGLWHHFALTSNGSTYQIWLDGVSQSLTVFDGTNSGEWFGDVNVGATRYTTIGGQYFSGSILSVVSFGGAIGETAIYPTPLAAEQVAALAAGTDALDLSVKPTSLIRSCREEDRDYITGEAWTPINSPGIAEHPPIARRRVWGGVSFAGDPITNDVSPRDYMLAARDLWHAGARSGQRCEPVLAGQATISGVRQGTIAW